MYWKNAPSTIWTGLTTTWNRFHHLRFGAALLALWYALFTLQNPYPEAITSFDEWLVGLAFLAIPVIGVTFILNALVSVIAEWLNTPLATGPESWNSATPT